MDFILKEAETKPEDVNDVVVRVRTSCWHDRNGFYEKRSFIYLKRKCKGFNWVENDLDEEVIARISSMNQVEDGIYSIVPINQSRDWETGMIDDYDYELIPYTE